MTVLTTISLARSFISLAVSLSAFRSARRHRSISQIIKSRQLVPGAEVFDPRGRTDG